MLILEGMGEFRASLISSATAYHQEPGEGGRESERERNWEVEEVVGGWLTGGIG